VSATILDRIVAAKRVRIAAGEFQPRLVPAFPSEGSRFVSALTAGGAASGPFRPSVIAEIKHRSPSAGSILENAGARLAPVARAYRRGGAAAISVVVEQDFFGGDPSWLPAVKAASGLPVLMKDFVVDEIQLDFALSLGADAVLLIVAAVDDAALSRLHAAARDRGLAVLVEAHDETEIRRALAAGAEIVGINARDLRTFAVDLPRMARMGAFLPDGAVRVAESGIHSRADVEGLAAAGFGAFLVGESLLRAEDPARELRRLRGVGSTDVKVCGLTREEDVARCLASGVDYLGLIFSPRSPRRLSLARALELGAATRPAKGIVAVFADNALDEILEIAGRLEPDVVQIADPPPAVVGLGRPIWRVVRVGMDDLGGALDGPGDALLFDTAVRGQAGGTGQTFDWSLLDGLAPDRPVVLAGGLTPANVAEAVRRVRPWAVDVASGVEAAPGVKDPNKISAFVDAVRGVPDRKDLHV
jgi:indole-3-glycerol phosphate synthase/phosphoribosylanthranilate isomerase